MKNTDGWWIAVPPNLPMGPHFPPREVEAARRRVVVKRALRVMLRDLELSDRDVLTGDPWPPTFLR